MGSNVAGIYSIQPDGHGSATFGNRNSILYVVDGSRVLFVDGAGGVFSTGFWARQQ